MSDRSPPRMPLHEKSHSQSNTQQQTSPSTTIRLIPKTPPRLLGSGPPRDDIYSRTPLPTLPSHFLLPGRGGGGGNGGNGGNGTSSGFGAGTGTGTGIADLGNGYDTEGTASGAAGEASVDGRVSAPAFSLAPVSEGEFQAGTKAQLSPGSSGSTGYNPGFATVTAGAATTATGSPIAKPKLPAKKRLHIHKDNKTFSLLKDDPSASHDDQHQQQQQHNDDFRSITSSGLSSPTSIKSFSRLLAQQKSIDSLRSIGRISENNAHDNINSIGSCVPTTPPASSSHVSATARTAPTKKEHQDRPITADHIAHSGSPWNYQLVGGLRKVPKTPDLRQKSVSPETDIPSLLNYSDGPSSFSLPSHDLATKPSFQSTETARSIETDTTTSETTNYKIYGNSSAANSEGALEQALPDVSNNYELIGSPSPTGSVIHRPNTAPSESDNENYEIYGSSSPLSSPEPPQPSAKYSHESLVVQPLKPKSKRPNENLGYYKQRSRESLRSGSLTSISTILIQQEAYKAIVGSGSLINVPILAAARLTKPRGGGEASSWTQPAPISILPLRSHMNEHPHVWSSQLSTVLSESDGGTDRGSGSWSENNGRRSSGFPSSQSRHSRQMLSISSSLAAELAAEEAAFARSQGRSGSLEPPAPAFTRTGRQTSQSSIRFVGDQDEYGDGITDMQDLRMRPSRTRLNSGLYSVSSSDNGRTSTMRSTASSRANSLLASSIPQWARLYYGSGERRAIPYAAGSSIAGETESRSGSFRTGSPNTDNFPLNIYSPRRRPRDGYGRQRSRESMNNQGVQEGEGSNVRDRDPRMRTWSLNSMWSPHLRHDRRAINRNAFVPPSVTWSSSGGAFGRRNIQVVMFVVGFIFPFAWMIAAIWPLPTNPMREMRERGDNSTDNLDESNDAVNEYARQVRPMDEARYESARWWRQLNRFMSFIGVLIIGAVITLVVVGLKQHW